MTALTQYTRLEATGIWRAPPDVRARDVIVKMGEATLVILDSNENALAHWSLAAVTRVPGSNPALFTPDPDSQETLEIDDAVMIEALGKVATAIERRRPHPGRLRRILWGSLALVTLGFGVFWLPDAMIRQTVTVVPKAKRIEIGRALTEELSDTIGLRICASAQGSRALAQMRQSVFGPRGPEILVVADSPVDILHMPGPLILVSQRIVTQFDNPEVLAGYLLAETTRIAAMDPLERLLRAEGLDAVFVLLTTGNLPASALVRHAPWVAAQVPDPLSNDAMLSAFKAANLRSAPFALAAGKPESDPLVVNDPVALVDARMLIPDTQWVALQGICAF